MAKPNKKAKMVVNRGFEVKKYAASYVSYVASDMDYREILLGDFVDELSRDLGLESDDDGIRDQLEEELDQAIGDIVVEIERRYGL